MIPKCNYKIFNSKTNSYISNGRKSTWIQKQAVLNKVKELIKDRPLDVNNLTIHIFPTVAAVIVPVSEFLASNQEDIQAKELKKEKRELAAKANDLKYKIERAMKEQAKIEALQAEYDKIQAKIKG